MSTIMKIFLRLFCFIPMFLIAGESVFDWDFRDAESDSRDWLKHWSPVTAAARDVNAVRVEDPPGNVSGNHRALVIMDQYDSSLTNESDQEGTPIFQCNIEPLKAGTLRFRAGTTGTQNQNASLTLRSNGRPLLILRLENNTTGMVVSQEGRQDFSDPQSWFNRARDFEVKWTEDGEVTFRFTTASGERTEFGPLRFLSPGHPDELLLQVGFGRATNRGLRIEKLSLTSL